MIRECRARSPMVNTSSPNHPAHRVKVEEWRWKLALVISVIVNLKSYLGQQQHHPVNQVLEVTWLNRWQSNSNTKLQLLKVQSLSTSHSRLRAQSIVHDQWISTLLAYPCSLLRYVRCLKSLKNHSTPLQRDPRAWANHLLQPMHLFVTFSDRKG